MCACFVFIFVAITIVNWKNSIKKLSAVMLKDFYLSLGTVLLEELYNSSFLVQVKLETNPHVTECIHHT